jgi:hypothetical protein
MSSEDTFNHMIVWLDQNIASPDCCKQLRKAFATTTNPENKTLTSIDELDISNLIHDDSTYGKSSFFQIPFYFKLFSQVEPCLRYLLNNAGKKRIFFITSGSLGEHIVPRILTDHQEIFKDENGKLYEDSIYIFCADMVKHGQWAIDYLDLDCIKMENDDEAILARLTRDIAKYFLSEGKNLLANNKNDLNSLKKSLKYFTWSKELYHKAQLVVKTHSSQTVLKDIDQLIIDTEFQIKQINNDDDKIGEEN